MTDLAAEDFVFGPQRGGGRGGGAEAELPRGPLFVDAAAVPGLRAGVVQMAALAQRGEVEQSRRGRGAVVDVRRRGPGGRIDKDQRLGTPLGLECRDLQAEVLLRGTDPGIANRPAGRPCLILRMCP